MILAAESWWDKHGDIAISTAVLAVIGIAAIYFTVRATRTRRQLDWVLLGSVPVPVSGIPSLTIRHGPVTLSQPRRVVVGVVNTGDVTIRPEDFVTPIEICFPSTVVYCSFRSLAYRGSAKPSVQRSSGDPAGRTWILNFARLTRHNMIKVEFVVDGPNPSYPTLSWEVDDQSRPPRAEPAMFRRAKFRFAAALTVLAQLLMVSVINFVLLPEGAIAGHLVGVFALLSALIALDTKWWFLFGEVRRYNEEEDTSEHSIE